MIKIAYCCEHTNDLNRIKNEVEQCLMEQGTGVESFCCSTPGELIGFCSKCMPDILFMDFNSHTKGLMDAAISLKRHNKNLISIVTNASDYTFNLSDNLSFLLEPVYKIPTLESSQLRYYACLACRMLNTSRNFFEFYKRPDYIRVQAKNIIYFSSEGRRTHISYIDYGARCHDIFYKKLDEVEDIMKIKNCNFIRIHKSYLVNADFITYFDRYTVVLKNGDSLNISRYEYYKRLRSCLLLLKPGDFESMRLKNSVSAH